jgi:hypothetical protein
VETCTFSLNPSVAQDETRIHEDPTAQQFGYLACLAVFLLDPNHKDPIDGIQEDLSSHIEGRGSIPIPGELVKSEPALCEIIFKGIQLLQSEVL